MRATPPPPHGPNLLTHLLTHLPTTMRRVLALAAVAMVAGCASPPVVRLHSLLPAGSLAAAAEATPPLPIHLATVTVPPAVDQSGWLVRLPDGSLLALAQDHWASPLRDEWRAALREWLAQRWGVVDSREAAAWRLAVDVTRFESIAGQEARLEARWTLTPIGAAASAGNAPTAQALGCRVLLRELVGAGTVALAEGHQRALARLAERIARQLRAAQQGAPWACEADPA